jgi:hypothetical protein
VFDGGGYDKSSIIEPAIHSLTPVPDLESNGFPIFPTSGGHRIDLTFNGKIEITYNWTAYIVDLNGEAPNIPVRGYNSDSEILTKLDETGVNDGDDQGVVDVGRQTISLRIPPGQGKNRRVMLVSSAFGYPIETLNNNNSRIGYAEPVIFRNTEVIKDWTEIPIETTTDTCPPRGYEYAQNWKQRISEINKGGIVDNKQLTRVVPEDDPLRDRRCLDHDTIVLIGDNFGEETDQLDVWVMCNNSRYEVFDGASANEYGWTLPTPEEDAQMSDILNRGFNGSSP